MELGSRYFVLYKQDDWLKTLQEYEKEGILLNFAEELENTKKIWKKSDKSDEETISFTYKVLINEEIVCFFRGSATISVGIVRLFYFVVSALDLPAFVTGQ